MATVPVFLIFAVAAFAQSVTGFGFALVAVPLLGSVIDPKAAVVTVGLVSLFLTTGTAMADHRHVRWTVALAFSGTALLGMPLGLLVLSEVSASTLTALIAVVVTGCAAIVWRGWQLEPTPLRVGAVGVLSGLLLTATGTYGPPLATAVRAFALEPRAFRATLAAVFTFSGALGVAGFFWSGEATRSTWQLCLVGGFASAIGGWTGSQVLSSLNGAHFRKIVLGALLLSAAVALARAVTTLL
ncbi:MULTISPECIES: sulfite exporter TauE/SafE family protein [unclassified Streptomyces]|uniref:sulfite exporter TauE/SafE family protein n=1 Tax=unclassified Streptomyces TaxID=2593676 RepID=UPI0033C8CC18